MFKREEYQRYSRQILLPEIDETGQKKLTESRVAIVGLGGLGNVAAGYLAASGVGYLTLIDDDNIEINNLQRQLLYQTQDLGLPKATLAKRRLNALNPHIHIDAQITRLNDSNCHGSLKSMDLILDCTDNLKSRFAINHASYRLKIPLLVGAANQFNGQYLPLHPEQDHGCYRCLYEPDQAAGNQCLDQGILGPVVGMMGMFQALDALKYLAGVAPVNWGTLHCFEGLRLALHHFALPKFSQCPTCGASA